MRILEILLNKLLFNSNNLFFFNLYIKIKTPIHDEIDVASGIIKNPT